MQYFMPTQLQVSALRNEASGVSSHWRPLEEAELEGDFRLSTGAVHTDGRLKRLVDTK